YWTASSQAHSTHGLGINKLLIPRHARVIVLAAGDVAKRSMACKSELMYTVCRTPAKVGARVGVSVDISLYKTIRWAPPVVPASYCQREDMRCLPFLRTQIGRASCRES